MTIFCPQCNTLLKLSVTDNPDFVVLDEEEILAMKLTKATTPSEGDPKNDPEVTNNLESDEATTVTPTVWTDEDEQELTRLEAAFEEAGGRGVDLAERIDELIAKRANAVVDGIAEHVREAIEEGEKEVAAENLHSLNDPTGLMTALEHMPSADDLKARPAFILSEVDGSIIGWDTCGDCHFHIRVCLCPNGPKQPRYVTHFRKQQEEREAALEAARKERERKAVVEADPDVVAEKVAEVLQDDERTPSGRKRRRDAGVPRGPRKKGTADSVLEAAGDLASAMSKES